MSLTQKTNELRKAAEALAVAYTDEMLQEPLDGLGCPPELQTPLGRLIVNTVEEGALPALMSSDIVEGNQTVAAPIYGWYRATVRKRLIRIGMVEQKSTQEAA